MAKKKLWKGFTLIEVTAVVGIVSTLSIGTYVGVQKGRERECINNLQQIYRAVMMFEMDNGNLPAASFFPSTFTDPKGIHNLLRQYLPEPIFFCPSIPEQLNRYGTNYLWNDNVNNKSLSSISSTTWLMTEMTAVSKDIPGPHTGRFSILYAGGNAQAGERISFPEVKPAPKPPEERREPVKEEKKTPPVISPTLTLLIKKEARVGEEVKISVSITDEKGNSLQIQPGRFLISIDAPSVNVPSFYEVKSAVSNFDFVSVFQKTGKFRIKVKEENSGIEGEAEINILPETTSKFSFPVFPALWEAGKPQTVHIIACDKAGNKTEDYNEEVVILPKTGKVSPEKVLLTKGIWIGELIMTEYSEGNSLYLSGERNIIDISPEFKVKNSTSALIDIYPESNEEPIAGIPYSIVMEIKDVYGNRCIDYTGEIEMKLPEGVTSEKTKVLLAPEDKGKKTISVTFFKAGNSKIHASDRNIKGEKEFYVNPGQLYSFSIGEIGTQEAGKPFSVLIKATDRWGNIVKGFYLKEPSKSIEYVNRDTSSGMWMETIVIKKAGQFTLSLEGSAGITGRSNTFTVKPSSPEKVEITGIPFELIAGREYSGVITVKDRFDNVITNYSGSFISETEGIKIEINGLNIKINPERKGYYKLTLKDTTNNKLSVEKHLFVISEEK